MLLALPLLVACTSNPDDAGDFAAQAVLSETQASVIKVSWEDLGADEILVEYGHGATFDRVRNVAPDATETLLLGLKPNSEVQLRVVQKVDDQVLESADITIQTDPLPSGLPTFYVDVPEPGALGNGLLITTLIQNPTSVLVFDGDGDVVWWTEMTDDTWVGRSRLSHDGEHILVQPINREGSGGHGLSKLDMEGNEVEVNWVDESHHDFAELPDGTLAFLVYEKQIYAGEQVLGDGIVELAPDGTETRVFSVFEAIGYDPSLDTLANAEWSHANYIEYVAEQDAYYVSFYGLKGIAKIDRPTGDIEWMFGGVVSDFEDSHGNTELLQIQHGFQVLDDSLLVFENGRTEAQSSRAVEFTLDEETKVTQPVWAYQPEPSLYTPSLGNVRRLDNGNTIVNFSSAGRIVEVTPEGEVVWQLDGSLGAAFGYSTWEKDLYVDP